MIRKHRVSLFFQIALFALTAGMLIYFCVSGNNLVLLLHSLPGLSLFWLLGSLFSVASSWLIEAVILRLLLKNAYGGEYTLRESFSVVMTGLYFTAITPFGFMGQPMQFLRLTRQGVPSGKAISALAQKYLVYQTAITCYSAAVLFLRSGFFSREMPGFLALAAVGFAYQSAMVIFLFFFTHNRKATAKLIRGILRLLAKVHIVKNLQQAEDKLNRQLDFYLESNKSMHKDHKRSFMVYGLTVLQQTAVFAVPFFLYKAFRCEGFPAVDMISAQCFVTMISSYTPLPGSAGAAEGSFLVLFRMFFREDILQQAMLLWRFISYYSCILIGAFFAGLGKDKKSLPGRKENADSSRGVHKL
jgi:uncharacterized protein (TIRG00374 family)